MTTINPFALSPELAKVVQIDGGKYKFPYMLAPSDPWTRETDITGWWISEKLDGCRALWTGTHFISRGARGEGGKIYNAPEWFKAQMPKGIVLDGELWLGRNMFDECSGILRREVPRDADWARITYVVFDTPMHGGVFEARQEFLAALFASITSKHITLHKQSRLESMDQVEPLLKLVKAMKGEGLIARRPGSPYAFGKRSPAMRKIITKVREDGLVVGYKPGKGKYVGMVGGLLVKLDDGVVAEVGTGLDDKDRANPPPVDTLVTIEYRERNEKTREPRFPAYIGVRESA